MDASEQRLPDHPEKHVMSWSLGNVLHCMRGLGYRNRLDGAGERPYNYCANNTGLGATYIPYYPM